MTSEPLRIWINAGETSGDMHAAMLLRALKAKRPDMLAMGMGGPDMRDVGYDEVLGIEALSVMGLSEILGHLPRILGLLKTIKREMAARKPHAVVLVDAPSFNFRVARMANKLDIPVFYYISPKAWAWNEKRVDFIRDHIRRLFCILPFEKDFYARHGVDVDYVGNPLLDSIGQDLLHRTRAEESPRRPNLVGVLPGSRRKEIETLTPILGRAAGIMRERVPELSFQIIRAPGVKEETLRALWPDEVPVDILPPEDRYERMARWQCCLAASGTVTLELALLGVPAVVTYKVAKATEWAGKLLIKVKYVSLPNLILDAPAFPELLQEQCNGPAIAAAALPWITDPAAGARIRTQLNLLQALVGNPGAPGRAASGILELL